MNESEAPEVELHRVRQATRAMTGLAIAWPVALVVTGLSLERDVPVALPVIPCGAVLVALIEVVRHASSVIARRSWSRPPGAFEISRVMRGLALALMVVFALVPAFGALGAFGFESVTAQVDSPRTTYTYRIEYEPLRPSLRRVIVILCAETTIAAAVAMSISGLA